MSSDLPLEPPSNEQGNDESPQRLVRGPKQVPADDEPIVEVKILPMAGTPGVVETEDGVIVPTINEFSEPTPQAKRFVENPAAVRNRRIAWAMVGLLSLVSLILGIIVLMDRIEMARWVGIAFLSLGIMGLMLLALPLFVNPVAQAAQQAGEPRNADGRLSR